MLFQKKKIDFPNNNNQCKIRLDLINYMINLNSEELRKYENECNKHSYSIINLKQSIQKINEIENEKSKESNDNNNICLKENLINNNNIEQNEKIGIIINNDNINLEENKNNNDDKEKSNVNNLKKYFLRDKKPKIMNFPNNNLIKQKRKRNIIKKKNETHQKLKKQKLNNTNEIKIKKNNLKKIINENEIKNEKNNSESLFDFLSYIDEKIECKKEKKYCKEKNKMSNEERKSFIQNIKEKIQKLTFKQIIQIQKKFFVNNNNNNNEINLNLNELDQEHLKRLNIYVDSYINDNLLNSNYISYIQELKNLNQIQLENKKYKSIFENISESDEFSDDDSYQSEKIIKNQFHNQKDSNSETMED